MKNECFPQRKNGSYTEQNVEKCYTVSGSQPQGKANASKRGLQGDMYIHLYLHTLRISSPDISGNLGVLVRNSQFQLRAAKHRHRYSRSASSICFLEKRIIVSNIYKFYLIQRWVGKTTEQIQVKQFFSVSWCQISQSFIVLKRHCYLFNTAALRNLNASTYGCFLQFLPQRICKYNSWWQFLLFIERTNFVHWRK